MTSFKTLTDEQFKQRVRLSCKMFAVKTYQRDHPDSTEAEAWTYASRTWRQFLDMALDWLAVCEADAEKLAAPWN